MFRRAARSIVAVTLGASTTWACVDILGIQVLPGDAGGAHAGDSGVLADSATDDARAPDAQMPAPSGWSSGEITFDDHFANLDNWNYGTTDDEASGANGAYAPWGQTGVSPDWGSVPQTGVLDYDLPGNVFQTSSGVFDAAVSTYTPQSFSPDGGGVSLLARYTGAKTWDTVPYGPLSLSWTSGAINTYNKFYFPTPGRTESYVQINARMMGATVAGSRSDNGAFNSIWFMGQGGEPALQIILQSTGIVDQSTTWVRSSLPNAVIGFKKEVDLSAGYHVYGMHLTNSEVTTYFDGVEIGSATLSVTVPCFILLSGNIASGTGQRSAPQSNVDMTLSVLEVRVYERGSDN